MPKLTEKEVAEYIALTKHIIIEPLSDIKLEKKYVIQNRTLSQQSFVARFLRLNCAFSNLSLHYNSKDIPYLRQYHYEHASRRYTRYTMGHTTIRCCLYKKNTLFHHYKGATWKKSPNQNDEYILTLTYLANSFTDLALFPTKYNTMLSSKKNQLRYPVNYIKKLFSYYYLKDELYTITQHINMPKDISNIIHSYCSFEY